MLQAPEPLTAEHDLSGFDSGLASLDDWLTRRALPNQASGASRTFVVRDGQAVVAYYALAASAVAPDAAPGRFRRNMPDPIPVVVLARLAIARNHQSRGLGRALFQDAATRVIQAADIMRPVRDRAPTRATHLQAVTRIERYTDAMDTAAFAQSELTQDAVIRNLEVIGEASRNIERGFPEFAAAHPELPLAIAYEMRNLLAHGYFKIDLAIVWKTFELQPLGPLTVKGFDAPVHAWRALGERALPSRFEAQHDRAPSVLVGRDSEVALLLDRHTEKESSAKRSPPSPRLWHPRVRPHCCA